MNWRRELALLVLLASIWGGLSFGHLAWGGQPLSRAVQRGLYGLLGGRAASGPAERPADPSRDVLRQENERLHELLALRSRLPGVSAAAAVLRREPDTWWSELLIEFSPPSEGLPKGTAVVLTPQGLIGTVEADQVRRLQGDSGRPICQATVRLLSSADTQLSVAVGSAQAPFLLEGKGAAEFALRPVTSEAEKQALPGDAVLTSGLGRLYSKGLQVGVVGKNSRRATFSTLAATPAEVVLWWR